MLYLTILALVNVLLARCLAQRIRISSERAILYLVVPDSSSGNAREHKQHLIDSYYQLSILALMMYSTLILNYHSLILLITLTSYSSSSLLLCNLTLSDSTKASLIVDMCIHEHAMIAASM